MVEENIKIVKQLSHIFHLEHNSFCAKFCFITDYLMPKKTHLYGCKIFLFLECATKEIAPTWFLIDNYISISEASQLEIQSNAILQIQACHAIKATIHTAMMENCFTEPPSGGYAFPWSLSHNATIQTNLYFFQGPTYYEIQTLF